MTVSQRASLGIFVLLSLSSPSAACKQGLAVPEHDGDAGDDDGLQTVRSNATADDVPAEPCERKDDGELCGEGKHCIKQQCVFNTCGDGVKAGEEECDDGNALLGDMCTPSCKQILSSCGDGTVDEGEECDDGNHLDTDGCADSCTKNICGNKRVDPGEECDDGNREDEDACANRCTFNLCRNGIVDPGEECDDGNTNPSDGCTNACQRILCGDGMPEQQEECDDGNRVNTDGCSNACTSNICGNNRVDPGEACDGPKTADGKPIPDGYFCDTTCTGFKNDDACRECERKSCSNYMDAMFDLPKYCYDEVSVEGMSGGITEFNKKCTALMRCIRQNNCDSDPALPEPDPIVCYCGKGTDLNECFTMANRQVGPCIAEFESATGATKGDYSVVVNNGTSLAFPSGVAYILAQCQSTQCSAECRRR